MAFVNPDAARLDKGIFIDRRSPDNFSVERRRAEFFNKFDAALFFSTSPRKGRRFDWWANAQKEIGEAVRSTQLERIKVKVDEPDYNDSGALGVEKQLRQIRAVNADTIWQAEFTKMEECGKRFALGVSCDVNVKAGEIGGGAEFGVRKDEGQANWAQRDYVKAITRRFGSYSSHGFTGQLERVDTASLLFVDNGKIWPLAIVPVVSKSYANVPKNPFANGSTGFAEQYVKYAWNHLGIGPARMEGMPLGVDWGPFLKELLHYYQGLYGGSALSYFPTVDLPDKPKGVLSEEVHFQNKLRLLRDEMDPNVSQYAHALARLDDEMAGPTSDSLSAGLDQIRSWVDRWNVVEGGLRVQAKGWRGMLAKPVILPTQYRVPWREGIAAI